MELKTLKILEYPKVLAKLAGHCSFSASKQLALNLSPTHDLALIRRMLVETSEARALLSVHDLGVGGAHDVTDKVKLARRGGVLDPTDLLDIKYTLIASRDLRAFFFGKKNIIEKLDKNSHKTTKINDPDADADSKKSPYPSLCIHAERITVPVGVIDQITKTISDKGEVLDNASPKLRSLRSELHIAKNRLMGRLQHYLGDAKSSQMLQESIITQRDGRYVIPLKSEFKGQIKAIVHDQSASGATLFIEPLAVVEMNNEIKEIEIAEKNEVRRILAELSGSVGAHEYDLIETMQAISDLDLIFAKAKYGDEMKASEPIMVASPGSSPKQIKLLKARHPLLDPSTAVANNIDLLEGTMAIVITGPNTGGKTVTLKTVGLLVLMSQSGMHIPAQSGSELSVFEEVYADIGDEQSIEQSLSTFSGHLTNIVSILQKANDQSLVIFDELGAGTDPQEGSALAMAILNHLLTNNITTFVATHYPELKTFAHNTPAVTNASLEFDVATLRPTYRLTLGLPGRSNALAIASRLGLPEHIIQDARQGIAPENLKADKLLDDIRKERNKASKERDKLTKTRQRNESLNLELASRLEKIEDERMDTINKARAEAELELEILKRNIGRLRAEFKKMQQSNQTATDLEKLEKRVEKISEKSQKAEERQQTAEVPSGNVRYKLGEKVYVRNLDKTGILTALSEIDAEVQIGSIRIRTRLGELQKQSVAVKEAQTASTSRTERIKKMAGNLGNGNTSGYKISFSMSSPGIELDLRGKTSEEAIDALSDYLDRAYLGGLPYSRIIHGKGTGKLRQEVRAFLANNPQVDSVEEGHPNEGGDGVTVVKFIKD